MSLNSSPFSVGSFPQSQPSLSLIVLLKTLSFPDVHDISLPLVPCLSDHSCQSSSTPPPSALVLAKFFLPTFIFAVTHTHTPAQNKIIKLTLISISLLFGGITIHSGTWVRVKLGSHPSQGLPQTQMQSATESWQFDLDVFFFCIPFAPTPLTAFCQLLSPLAVPLIWCPASSLLIPFYPPTPLPEWSISINLTMGLKSFNCSPLFPVKVQSPEQDIQSPPWF